MHYWKCQAWYFASRPAPPVKFFEELKENPRGMASDEKLRTV